MTSAKGSRASWRASITGLVLAVGLLYGLLQIGAGLPYHAPAGHGLTVSGDPALVGQPDRRAAIARPPAPVAAPRAGRVLGVRPRSAADAAGLSEADTVVEVRSLQTGQRVVLAGAASPDPAVQLRLWREAYWLGTRGEVELRVQRAGIPRDVMLARVPVWHVDGDRQAEWTTRYTGRLVMMAAFLAGAAILLLLRTSDFTAHVAIVALVLCAIANGGPLLGAEHLLPDPLARAMTAAAWVATPIAFPFVALGIAYFPRPGAYLQRRPWLAAVPLALAAPMAIVGAGTGLFLAGVDTALPVAVWDARHPRVFFANFALSLAFNVVALADGWRRFQATRDPNERRRIQLALYLTVPGVLAYALFEGLPTAVAVATGMRLELPWFVGLPLQVVSALPAFGVTYAVAVHRVLSPRVALRSSLQYALARKTLGLLLVLPALALAVALVKERDMSLTEIVTGRPLFYVATLALIALGLKYRDRASAWLDRRFFREQYDARRILLSLAGRVPYETDPNELTALVVEQIDTALHPRMAAVLVSGLEPDALVPVAVLHGSVEPLAEDGGLASMLRWSSDPLEIYLEDTRSPARRLPPVEQEWLECTRAVLLVPVVAPQASGGQLLGVLVLGEKRSEEPYTAEDRDLLASIAAQVAVGLDVARLRLRQSIPGPAQPTLGGSAIATSTGVIVPMVECPRCGRCEDGGTGACPDDGTPMRVAVGLPRVIESKYRVEQLLGRGGMGAVYRARDMRLDRHVAIKVVRADLLGDPDARTRFRREAQIVARLQHPSVVSIFDYGTLPDGGAFLVMEYVRGHDLRWLLKRDGPVPPARLVLLMRAICAAIEAAHAEGILHRDLKPENVLLPESGVDAKVLDFGVAKLVADDRADETLTQAGQAIGTPAYMAPEQLAGGVVTPRTDVFGLGVIAYELLSGELPFGKGPLLEIARRQLTPPPPPVGARGPVPAAMTDIVLAALRAEPDRRPPSAAAFGRGLESALAGGGIRSDANTA